MQIRDGHIIEKLVVDVTTSTAEHGYAIKDNVRSFIDRCIVPAIEEYFASLETGLPEGKVLRIDKLSLDISTRESDWDTAELEFAIKQEFGKVLEQNHQELSAMERIREKAARKTEPSDDRNVQEEGPKMHVFSSEQLQLDAWYHFLQHGMRPWWSREGTIDPELQEQQLMSLLSANAQPVRQRLLFLVETASVRKRMIRQFSDDFLPKILVLLATGELPATGPVTLNGETAAVDEWIARLERRGLVREAFWEMALSYLLQVKKGTARPDTLVLSELSAIVALSRSGVSPKEEVVRMRIAALKLLHVLTGKKEQESYYAKLSETLQETVQDQQMQWQKSPEKDPQQKTTEPGQSASKKQLQPGKTEKDAAEKAAIDSAGNQSQSDPQETVQQPLSEQQPFASGREPSKEQQKTNDETERIGDKERTKHIEKVSGTDAVAGKEPIGSDLKKTEDASILQQQPSETVNEAIPGVAAASESVSETREMSPSDKKELPDDERLSAKTTEISPLAAEQHPVTYDEPETTGMQLMVDNAGLVLVYPFLKHLFSRIGLLTEDNKLTDKTLAAHVLHYIATGRENDYEHTMLLEKYLAGIPLMESIPRAIPISDEIKAEVSGLLEAVKQNWKPMSGSSHDAIRETFLRREGKLIDELPHPRMIIERKTVDILLNQLSWTISIIRLPWMDKLIYVEW